ncbi:MAG: hypothetical protein ACOC03_00660 [Desulfosalsimonas sp.]
MDDSHIYAVITGDFIGFSGLEPKVRSYMPQVMAGAGSLLRTVLPGVMPKNIDVFRGDSWQALIEDPVYVLRAALLIHAFIRSDIRGAGLSTRMAIGVGPVDYFAAKGVSAGDGPAFRRSGKMLEKMTSSQKHALLRYCRPEDPCESVMDALMHTIGALSGNWRPLQARAVLGVLKGMKQSEIAKNWHEPVSPQAVSRHLKKACWPAVFNALEVFESLHRTTI